MASNGPDTSGGANLKKRKKTYAALTLQQKLEVVREKEAGVPVDEIASRCGVDKSTVRKWVRERKKLEKYSGFPPMKRVRPSPVEKVNQALVAWFHQERRRNEAISVTQVKVKAQEFFRQFGGMAKFKASDGWFRTWRKKNGIDMLFSTIEKVPAEVETAMKFKTEILETVEQEQLKLSQIFNVGETRLYYKLMPDETLADRITNNRDVKDKLTMMVCCNASGTLKVPLLVTGRRHLKNVPPRLPLVKYIHQSSTSINGAIFESWFKVDFVPSVIAFLKSNGLPEKAILLLDNAKIQSSTDVLTMDGVRAVFLPENVRSLIQPLDQGVLEDVKKRYRLKLLSFVSKSQEDGQGYNDSIESFKIRQALRFINEAWNEVTEETISNSWNNLLNLSHHVQIDSTDNSEEITCERIHQILKNIRNFENITLDEVNEWIQADSNSLTDEAEDEPCSDSEDTDAESNDPSKALEAVNYLISFCEINEFPGADMKTLKLVRNQILRLKEDL